MMNAFCQIRHGGYVVDLGFISLKEAKDLANAEAKDTKRTMVLWFFQQSSRQMGSALSASPIRYEISFRTKKGGQQCLTKI